DDAPPALWLTLTADSSTLRTDERWEVSLAGSTWRSGALASTAKRPAPANLLAGGEKISDVLPHSWRAWTAFSVLAVLLTFAAGWWLARITARPNGGSAEFSAGNSSPCSDYAASPGSFFLEITRKCCRSRAATIPR